MKNIISVTLLFMFFTSCAQSKIHNNVSKEVKLDWTENTFIKQYIDSIKTSTKENKISEFLSNDCFDYDNKFYWKSKHDPKSLRKQIIYGINDINLLKFLLKNKTQLSDEICIDKLEQPYGGAPSLIDSQNESNLQLIKNRLKELENN